MLVGKQTEKSRVCIDYARLNERRGLWVRALRGSSKLFVITYARQISYYFPDVKRKMKIYVQSIKNMDMFIVPPGEVQVPRFIALSRVQLSITT